MNIHLPAILGLGTRVLTHPQIVTHLQIDTAPKMLDPWAKYSRGGAPQQQRRGGQGWGWRRRQWTGLLDLGLGLSLQGNRGRIWARIWGNLWGFLVHIFMMNYGDLSCMCCIGNLYIEIHGD